jgi:cytochrome P450
VRAYLQRLFAWRALRVGAAMDSLRKMVAALRSPAARKALGGAALVYALYLVKRYLAFLKWRRSMMSAFPGSSAPSLLLGDVQELLKCGGFGEPFFDALHAQHGEFARFFLGPTILNLSMSNPEHVLELYKKTRSRPFETYMFLSYLGKENLLFTHGEMVKKLRLRYGKMISNVEQLRKLNDISFTEFGKLVSGWGAQPGGVEIHAQLGPVIYDIMGQTLFGGSWSTSDAGKSIMEHHKYLIKNTNKWMFWPFPPYFLAEYNEYVDTIKRWRALCWQLIEERRAAIAADPKAWAGDESALTLLVTSTDEEGRPFFSKERAISTMCGFLNGAYDTTHATVYWLTYNLANYQASQESLRKELRAVLGDRVACSLDELRALPYLDSFFKESMRFNVTVPINQRVNYEEDVQIGDYVVPKGTNVNIPLKLVLRDQRFFGADANQFRPERFDESDPLAETAKRVHTAFGGHSRMCVGEVFAKGELKAFLITLLQRYKVEFLDPSAVSDEPYVEAGVNQPKHKALFKFTPLDQSAEAATNNLQWWTPEKNARKTVRA